MADKPADHESEYGDVEYADPKNHKYPINNEARVRAAWSYINMPKNQKGYTAAEVAGIKGRIKAAGKKYGIQFEGDTERSAAELVEQRSTVVKVELRSTNEHGNGRDIGGYAAIFNKPSKMMNGPRGVYVETVSSGFFNQDRADGWPGAGSGVVCRFNHDDQYLLGTTRSGTLRLGV